MLPFDTLVAFFGIALVLALTPGPDNLFVLMQSALWGRSAGMCVVLGLCTGVLGHTAAIAAGLAAIVATSAYAFTILKFAGALYLAYLAWGALRTRNGSTSAARTPAMAPAALYRRGVLMSLTNPKVLLFFLAFLPQFTSPDPAYGPVALQTIVLGIIFMLAALLVFSAIAVFSGTLGPMLQRSPAASLWLHRVTGIVFLGLAIRLAATSR